MLTARQARSSSSGVALEIGWHVPGDAVPLREPQLVRNGEVVRAFYIRGGSTEFEIAFDVEEAERAWYLARRLGSNGYQIAITSPVYFAAPGSAAPEPAVARVAAVSVRQLTAKAA